jgi:hypothetical protein
MNGCCDFWVYFCGGFFVEKPNGCCDFWVCFLWSFQW